MLSDHRDERDETQQAVESTPLLSTAATTLRYDGQTDGNAGHDADATSMTDRSSGPISSKVSKSKRIRWPSIIAMIVLSLFAVAVVVLGFVVPAAVEEYAKQAAVLEPTDLSLVSITAEGVRIRIQANFRLDAQRVPDGKVRSIGKTVGWLIGEIKTGPTKINVYLPQQDDMLLGTAAVPPLSVSITAGQNNAIDIVADLIPGEAESIRTIANEWLQGRLETVQLRGQADVQLTAGVIPLGTHSIVESMMFEGQALYRSFASLYSGKKFLA